MTVTMLPRALKTSLTSFLDQRARKKLRKEVSHARWMNLILSSMKFSHGRKKVPPENKSSKGDRHLHTFQLRSRLEDPLWRTRALSRPWPSVEMPWITTQVTYSLVGLFCRAISMFKSWSWAQTKSLSNSRISQTF